MYFCPSSHHMHFCNAYPCPGTFFNFVFLDRENKADQFAVFFFFCFGVLLVYLPTTNKLMKVLDTDLFLIFSLSIYDSKKKKGGKQEVEVRRRDHNDLCESLRCACVCVDLSIEENSKSKKSVSLLLSFTCVRCNGMLCLSACRWV